MENLVCFLPIRIFNFTKTENQVTSLVKSWSSVEISIFIALAIFFFQFAAKIYHQYCFKSNDLAENGTNEKHDLSWDSINDDVCQNGSETESIIFNNLKQFNSKALRSGELWRSNPEKNSDGVRIAPGGKIVQICIGCHFYYIKDKGLCIHQKSCTYFLHRKANSEFIFSSTVVDEI
jgi:hypothetical protein